jgi:hypothetical protein
MTGGTDALANEVRCSITVPLNFSPANLYEILTKALGEGREDWVLSVAARTRATPEMIDGYLLATGNPEDTLTRECWIHVALGGSILVRVGTFGRPYTLTLNMLLKGIDNYLSSPENLFMFANGIGTEQVAEAIDAQVADEMIQFALFGKVKYA